MSEVNHCVVGDQINMRARRLKFAILFLAGFFLLASSAFASSVQMTFLGGTSNKTGGPATYPYYFSINGGGNSSLLICDSYNNHITPGESWQANMTSILSGQGLFGSELLDYKAAGLIFENSLGGQIDSVAGNWAIWGLFSSDARENHLFSSTGAAGIDAVYLALAATAPDSAFRGLVLYTPIRGSQSDRELGLPQEFIGYTPVPEPASLGLLGTGLLALSGAIRRKFLQS